MIADELDTLARNLDVLARLGRTLQRPLTEDAPFLSTQAWHTHIAKLARVIDQVDTMKALGVIYQNADSFRARFEADGPNAPIPPERLATLREHATDARTLTLAAARVAIRRLKFTRG